MLEFMLLLILISFLGGYYADRYEFTNKIKIILDKYMDKKK